MIVVIEDPAVSLVYIDVFMIQLSNIDSPMHEKYISIN